MAITHDRYFLDNVAQWILELDRGKGLPFEGNYSSWLEQKQERLEREETRNDAASARSRANSSGCAWAQGPPGQGQGAPQRVREAARRGQGAEQRTPQLQITIPPDAPRRQVIEVENLRKGFGDKLLIDDLSFTLPPAGIVGIIGPNGAGKTTLFKMLAGREEPDAGSIKIGDTVELSYVDQTATTSIPTTRSTRRSPAAATYSKSADARSTAAPTCRSFNFKGTDQQKRVGDLSGGERNRVHLAKLLKSGGNVLLLDEPTNDLDVDTLRALEAGLESFPGCAVVISHDRWFLDRIATHVLAFEGDSQVRWFEGNFSEYEDRRKQELGAAADHPHRIKYKKLA